jgi:hypothetical protein
VRSPATVLVVLTGLASGYSQFTITTNSQIASHKTGGYHGQLRLCICWQMWCKRSHCICRRLKLVSLRATVKLHWCSMHATKPPHKCVLRRPVWQETMCMMLMGSQAFVPTDSQKKVLPYSCSDQTSDWERNNQHWQFIWVTIVKARWISLINSRIIPRFPALPRPCLMGASSDSWLRPPR